MYFSHFNDSKTLNTHYRNVENNFLCFTKNKHIFFAL